MNALELADELEAFYVDPDGFSYMIDEAVTMLRAQQTEITELIKHLEFAGIVVERKAQKK
jgi:hypothetical protein